MCKALRLGTVTTTAFLGITAALAAQENFLVEINRITSSGVGETIGKVAISQSKVRLQLPSLCEGIAIRPTGLSRSREG